MFFFSSRIRHTRCLSDWSSDVCSSDLGADPGQRGTGDGRRREHIVTRDCHRAGGVTDVNHRPQRHHVAIGVTDLYLMEIGRASCREGEYMVYDAWNHGVACVRGYTDTT